MFSVLLIVALLLAFYMVVALSGDPGGPMIDLVTWCLEKQQSALGLIGAAATAVPALALGMANDKGGAVTRRGWTYLAILAVTYVVATATNFILEPANINLGSAETPTMADATALSISAFALAYMAAILGLNRAAGNAASSKPKGAPAPHPAPGRDTGDTP
jgi:hypothetical protein